MRITAEKLSEVLHEMSNLATKLKAIELRLIEVRTELLTSIDYKKKGGEIKKTKSLEMLKI